MRFNVVSARTESWFAFITPISCTFMLVIIHKHIPETEIPVLGVIKKALVDFIWVIREEISCLLYDNVENVS